MVELKIEDIKTGKGKACKARNSMFIVLYYTGAGIRALKIC